MFVEQEGVLPQLGTGLDPSEHSQPQEGEPLMPDTLGAFSLVAFVMPTVSVGY
jgi:hypothetical protein